MIATAFDNQAQTMLGKSAAEMKRLKSADPAAYDSVFVKAQWKQMLFRLRTKIETYNGQSRLKSTLLSANGINFATEGALLVKDIGMYDIPRFVPSPNTDEAFVTDAKEVPMDDGHVVAKESAAADTREQFQQIA